MEDRKQFFSRLADLSEHDRAMVELAYMLAKYAHRAQRRQETDDDGEKLRYFEHPRRVALIMIDELGILDWEAIAIALLHDVCEDTDYATARQIGVWFSHRVGECVGIVSKLPKARYVELLAGCSEWRALFAKGCDTLDNLRSLDACDAAKRERKIRDYGETYRPVWDRMVEVAPHPMRSVAERLRKALYDEMARLRDA